MLGKLIARWRTRRAAADAFAREFVKSYGTLQMTNHWGDGTGRLGFTVDQADERIAIAPELLGDIPRDEDGLLVFAALNGTWRYRVAGEVTVRRGPTITLAELVGVARLKPVANLPTEPATPADDSTRYEPPPPFASPGVAPPACACTGTAVVGPGDTLIVATNATAQQAKHFGDQLRAHLPDTVQVLVVSATALAVVRSEEA